MTPPHRSPVHHFLAIPMALLLVAGPGSFDAWAATLNWKNAVNGNAGLAGNWNPSQVPQAGDIATFNVGGAYVVTFDGSADTTSTHSYRSGAVTLISTTH